VTNQLSGVFVRVMTTSGIERINKVLEKGAEKYSQNAYLRAIVSAIPGIGSSMDVLFSDIWMKKQAERIEGWIGFLHKEMESVKEEKLNNDYLQSDEFLDLTVSAMTAATRTRNEEKQKLYAKILKGAVLTEGDAADDPEEYLTMLQELSPKELEVARCIFSLERPGVSIDPRIDVIILAQVFPKLAGYELEYILLRLENAGLIKEKLFMNQAGGSYQMTEIFRKLMRFLNEEH
jgi:hypothetical protein